MEKNMVNNLLISFIIICCSCCTTKRIVVNNDHSENMVLIKGGVFNMGNDSITINNLAKNYKLPFDYLSPEAPKHRVKISSFYIDKYEVTNAEFKRFIDVNPKWSKPNIPEEYHNGNYLKTWINNSYPAGEDKFPVTYITWYAAMAYAEWSGKRLPTEAEWEFAAKSGKDQGIAYPWGNEDADSTKANYFKTHIGHSVAIGTYPPNEIGIFDMAGNVWEYCLDEWNKNFYSQSPLTNPLSGKDSIANYIIVKNRRVIRGGSWGGSAINLRTTFRDSHPVTGAGNHVGFRCVKDIK